MIQALELKIPPLVLVALFALAMWLLTLVVPAVTLPAVWHLVLAGIFAISGAGVALAGVLAFRRVKTTVDPRVPQQSSSLVIRGIYRYSRKQPYVCRFFIAAVGVELLFDECGGFGAAAAVCAVYEPVSDSAGRALFTAKVWC